MMSLWECCTKGCRSTAVGNGPATGLRAIGWSVIVGGDPRGGPMLTCAGCVALQEEWGQLERLRFDDALSRQAKTLPQPFDLYSKMKEEDELVWDSLHRHSLDIPKVP